MAGCWCTARFLVSSFTSSPRCVWAEAREAARELILSFQSAQPSGQDRSLAVKGCILEEDKNGCCSILNRVERNSGPGLWVIGQFAGGISLTSEQAGVWGLVYPTECL